MPNLFGYITVCDEKRPKKWAGTDLTPGITTYHKLCMLNMYMNLLVFLYDYRSTLAISTHVHWIINSFRKIHFNKIISWLAYSQNWLYFLLDDHNIGYIIIRPIFCCKITNKCENILFFKKMLSYIPCFFKTNSSNLKMKMKIIITFSLGFFFWRGGEGG